MREVRLNKKYVLPLILFIIGFLERIYAVITNLNNFFDANTMFLLLELCCQACVILYCADVLKDKKYFVYGLSIIAGINFIYVCMRINIELIDFYLATPIVYILCLLVMLAFKLKPNLFWVLVGNLLWCIYGFLLMFNLAEAVQYDFFFRFILNSGLIFSLFSVWWFEAGGLILKLNTLFRTVENKSELEQKLREYKEMHIQNIIDDQEYSEKKTQILNQLWVNDEKEMLILNIEELKKDKRTCKLGIATLVIIVAVGLFAFSNQYSIKKDIKYVTEILMTEDVNTFKKEHPEAEYASYGEYAIERTFFGVQGTYEVNSDSWNDDYAFDLIRFTWEDDKNSQKILNILDKYLGEGDYDYYNGTYEWETEEIEIHYFITKNKTTFYRLD